MWAEGRLTIGTRRVLGLSAEGRILGFFFSLQK